MLRMFISIYVFVIAGNTLAADKKIIAPAGTSLDLPFSPAVMSGDFLYLAGSIGNEPGTLEVPEGIEAQVRNTMDNLGMVLQEAGLDFSHVVSSNVFLSDARHYQAANQIYRGYFENAPQIRATIQADIAIPDALVEISMVAVKPHLEKKIIRPSRMKVPKLPNSWGIQVGDTLFIDGVTSRKPDTYQPMYGDIAAQTRQVLQNVGMVLEGAGMGYENVVRCSVFMNDTRYFNQMNEVYRTFFTNDPPARATVRGKLMDPRFLLKIQCTAVKDSNRRVVVAEGVPRSSSPYSPAIEAGNRLYLAGFVGRGTDGNVNGDIKDQTRQALENIRTTLKTAGMTFDNVVDVMVYISDIRFYPAMNEVYAEMMPNPPPARATIGAQLMSAEQLVEIMMTATR